MMIQSMRSGTSVQSGERAGCVGCHDERRTAPPAWPPRRRWPCAGRPAAWKAGTGRRGSSASWPRSSRFSPGTASGCHDYGKPAGRKLNLAPDRTLTFNTAYMELWQKRYIKCVGAGPAEIQPAYSWGSHRQPARRGAVDARLPRP